MAHFAKINENNVVVEVTVVHNDDIMIDGRESEQRGIELCSSLLGGNWLQTSYNANFRKNYAGIGYVYDASLDAFIPPQPFTSWILDEHTCRWHAPVTYPADGKMYEWSEEEKNWIEHVYPTPQ
jgi:hypothetical protein